MRRRAPEQEAHEEEGRMMLQAGKVVHGDCLKVLSKASGNQFDTVLLDWPYSVGSAVRGKDDGAAARVYGPVSFIVRVLQQLHRVAKDGCHMYVFGDWRSIPDTGFSLSLAGWYPVTIIAWDKCYVGTGGFWRSSWDPIFFCSKGPASKRTDRAFPNVIRTPSVRQTREHPYEKPSALWDRLAEVSVVPGCYVLDPFAGSASSRDPVVSHGGVWYGIDVDPLYATARCEVVADLFTDEPNWHVADRNE